MKWIVIEKSSRRLTLFADGQAVLRCRAALGANPTGHKRQEGDGRTPEGDYFVCLKREGKYGPSLGVSYPNVLDAEVGGLPRETVSLIAERAARSERPPWGTPLGGEIYIHAGGSSRDWTQGCVALDDADMRALYDLADVGDTILIKP